MRTYYDNVIRFNILCYLILYVYDPINLSPHERAFKLRKQIRKVIQPA